MSYHILIYYKAVSLNNLLELEQKVRSKDQNRKFGGSSKCINTYLRVQKQWAKDELFNTYVENHGKTCLKEKKDPAILPTSLNKVHPRCIETENPGGDLMPL